MIDLRKAVRASPGRGRRVGLLLGVTAGAACLVVVGIYALHVTSLYGYVWFAFAFETPLSGALAYSGPNALTYAPDVLVPQLAAATGDNPATPVTDLSKAA